MRKLVDYSSLCASVQLHLNIRPRECVQDMYGSLLGGFNARPCLIA